MRCDLMMKTLTVAAMTLALGLASSASSQTPPTALQTATVTEQANLTLGLADSQVVPLDLPAGDITPAYVPVAIDGVDQLLILRPFSVRAEGYRLLAQVEDGSIEVREPGAVRTVRGELLGLPGSRLAGSLLDDGLHVRVEMPWGEVWWIEPIGGRVAGADLNDHVLYRETDVLETGHVCGIDLLPDARLYADYLGGKTDGADGPRAALQIAELACDADYEYYLDWGSVAAVENRINTVINTMNQQYESEVGISHAITTILVRTSSNQPYTSTDATTLLYSFRDHWNANHGNIQRDTAHLFTGKEVDGGTIGIAWVGVICNLSYAYGVVQSDFNGNYASATDLSAHELGHNWSADHCNCTSNTMNPYITSANTFHETFTRPEIESFRDSRTCLDDGGTADTGACCVDTDCTIETEVDCLGIGGVWQGANTDCSNDPCAPQTEVYNYATSDFATDNGEITGGSYLDTRTQNDGYEVLTEEHTGGKPSGRYSLLSHTWSFNIAAGTSYTLYLDAYHDANNEGDDFVFSYSTDGGNFTPMLTVTKTSDNDGLQSYAFGADIAGALYIRVEDTNRTQGYGATDSVYVDHLYIVSQTDGADVTPPSPPTGLTASGGDALVTLDWADNGEPDFAGYDVYRATSSGGPYTKITANSQANSDYSDGGVVNGTTYYYVVTASDTTGNESGYSDEAFATPNATGDPTSMYVGSIVVTLEKGPRGTSFGRADVLILDNLGQPRQGAIVTGTFSGDYGEQVAAATGADGVAVLRTSTSIKRPTFDLCVDDVEAADLLYDEGSNVETCDVP
ncbi:MAG: M12 family metallo-peptidase [Phycisphaerales bacterium JB038]